ncbi:MAG: hypothetical protein HYU36_24740 [Planctomycetes bacterium]|nr:hypothetical protein [Planctomycetota bacterium]
MGWFLVGVLLAAHAPPASAAPAENLLANPGFERDRDRDGIPDGWKRIAHEKLSGRFSLVEDAWEGRRAVCLETEEWNFLRPQYIAQEVKLPPGSAFCALSAQARGRGLFAVAVQFRRAGRPIEEETVDMGFGPQRTAREVKRDFALDLEYLPYEAVFEVPPDADAALVKLGNTAGPLDRFNLWGRCRLDAAFFAAGRLEDLRRRARRTETVLELENQPAAPGLKNIAPCCRIGLDPPALDSGLLADGDIHTTAEFYPGIERGGICAFRFPRPLPVKSIRLHLNGAAASYSIRGDADGDGRFEALLARPQGLEGLSGWKTHFLPGDTYHEVRIQALEGTGLWGFRQTLPYVTEVEIGVPAAAVTEAELGEWSALRREDSPPGGVPAIDVRPSSFTVEPVKGKFRKMVCADLWMWGIDYGPATKKGDWTRERVKESPIFRENANIVRGMGVDTVFIDLTNSSCWDLMPWPSRAGRGAEDNVLAALIAALHDEGLQVVTETLHNISPFETVKWHYPCEETSRYPGMKSFPSILYGGHVRDQWLTLYEEQVQAGADGVCLGSDEFYYRGHFLETLPADDAQRQHYRTTHGREAPEKEGDSLAYRWWVHDTGQGLAGLFAYWNSELKKRHPGLYTCTVFMQPVQRSNLYGDGVPFDRVAAAGGADELGGDYFTPWGLRLLTSANGWRRSTHIFWGWQAASDPPIQLYGKALWMLMYGGGSCNYWRYYQLKESGHSESVKKGYAMVRDLEALGAWDARPPRSIAVLSSRASWDWWQVKSAYGRLESAEDDRGVQAQKGWYVDEWVQDRLLLRNGYPYDGYFLDNPDHLRQLEGYRLLLLPFPYSVSEDAADRVRQAADRGARIILFNARGETDEWGEHRKTPAFHDLVDQGKAVWISDDLLQIGGDSAFLRSVQAQVDAALGEAHPFKMHRYGRPIDATLLIRNEQEKFLFVLNWGDQPAAVDFSVPVPTGDYRILMRDESGWHDAGLGGSPVLSSEALKRFRRMIPARRGEVYFISPREKSAKRLE